MVDVSMSEQYPAYGCGRHNQALPIAQSQVFWSLKETAVDHRPAPVGIEHIFRTRNGPGSAEKLEC